MVYRGYGTRYKVYLRGHVLDDRSVFEAQKTDKIRKNLRATLARYVSTAIPDVRVKISFNGIERILLTDEKGLFETVLQFSEPLDNDGWLKAEYQVLDTLEEGQELLKTEGDVFVLSEKQKTAVISDIDDTVLISYSTEPFKKLRLLLTRNAQTRMPFEDVVEFYNAIHKKTSLSENNPFFYVSSSEWNLYDFLEDFFRAKNLPKGPFFLKELKTSLWKLITSGGGSHEHKLEMAEHILNVYPFLEFILFGDSGQMDAELYGRLAQKYPERIKLIIIRDVSKRRNEEKILKISEELNKIGVPMYMVEDTDNAWHIAAEKGLIDPRDKDLQEKRSMPD